MNFDPTSLLSGINFVELIFEVLSTLTFLADIFIGAALVAALIRGIFKKFWKVVWRGVVFILLFVAVIIFSDMLFPYIAQLPIGLKGDVDGVAVAYANLGEVINGMIAQAGYTGEYATNFYTLIMKNLMLFFAIPLLGMITPIVSGITYPIISLLIPKKVRKLKLIPAKIALSMAFSVIAVILFSIPMANLVPALAAIQPSIDETSVLFKFLNPSLIEFLKIFTSEHSIFLKIFDFGSYANGTLLYKSFKDGAATVEIGDAITGLVTALNGIPFTAAS